MYRGHVNYNKVVNESDLEIYNEKIQEEKQSINPDKLKIAKLEQAKMLYGLFNNDFSIRGRNMMPW